MKGQGKLTQNRNLGPDKRLSLLILVMVVLVGLAVAIYLYNLESHSLYFYADSTSHAVAGRSYIDSDKPGFFEHLGTGWLPLPHILLIPFTLIDPLFTTGFAGLMISLPFHAISSLVIYKIIRTHVNNQYVPFIGALLYAFNPNFLYLSTTSMTEAPFMFFFLASAYYFQKWLFDLPNIVNLQANGNNKFLSVISSSSSLNLYKSAFFVSMATLCRYEAWMTSAALVIIVLITIFIRKRNSQHHGGNISLIIIFTIISFSGIIFWLAWNAYHYGDALEFANNPIFSAAAQALQRGDRAYLYLQPLNVLNVYGTTLLFIFGPAVLVSSLLGFIVTIFQRKDTEKRRRLLFYLFLVMPSLFTILSMVSGIGEMNLTNWFNSRFAVFSAPLIVILACVFISYIFGKVENFKIKRKNLIVISLVAALFVYQSVSPFFTVVTFADALWEFSGKDRLAQINVGQVLHSVYDGNETIFMLITSAARNKIMIESGLPLEEFRSIRDSNSDSNSFSKPYQYSNYLVLSKQPKNEIKYVASYWLNNQNILENFYNKVYEDNYFLVFAKGNVTSKVTSNLNGILDSNVNAKNCIDYNPNSVTISIKCNSADLLDVYNSLNYTKAIQKENSKSWILNANLEIKNGSNFYINSTHTPWLKINSTNDIPYKIKAQGNLIIDSVKITSWNLIKNNYAMTDKNGTIPRSYITIKDGNGTTNITNSEIAYLGYKSGQGSGLAYYAGAGSHIQNSRVHDLWHGFSSQGDVYNITLDNNTFYNNTVHGIYGHKGTHDMVIKNNHVFNNGRHGIICSIDCYNIMIESNKAYNNSKEGIILSENVSQSVIRNNTVYNNTDQIGIYDHSHNNQVYKNTLGGGKVGIRVNTNSTSNHIYNNTIISPTHGVYFLKGASDNIIEFNVITNTSDTAINVKDNTTKSNIFKNNYLLDNRKSVNKDLNTNQTLLINNTINPQDKQ